LREVKDDREPNQEEERSNTFTEFSGEKRLYGGDLGAALPQLDWNKEMNALSKFKRDFYTVSKIIQKDSFF